MTKIFIVSDTHFNHANIIKYACRPFENIQDMNQALIEGWNSVVRPNDKVFHLGDFGFGTDEQITSILSQLNGNKTLILGNHDLTKSPRRWIQNFLYC